MHVQLVDERREKLPDPDVIAGVPVERVDGLAHLRCQLRQRAGVVPGGRGEGVELERVPQRRDARMRVGLEPVGGQVRPAHQVGLGDA
jgi:hypothetical protein